MFISNIVCLFKIIITFRICPLYKKVLLLLFYKVVLKYFSVVDIVGHVI